MSRPPSLFMSMHRPMHGTSCPKSQLKSTCLTAKFGSFLDHVETGKKGQNVISSSVQHPISLIFAIHVSFIITFTNDVDFVDKAYGRMSWTGPSNTVELFHGSPFLNVFCNFLSISTMSSTLTLVSICSLISLLWNKKSPRSLGCIIRKLQYKIYRYVPQAYKIHRTMGPPVPEKNWPRRKCSKLKN